MKPVLILGIGNILLRDEGIGVRVVEALQQGVLPEHVEVVDGGTSGADLIGTLADRPKVIVVDAVCADCAPGVVLKFSDSDLIAQRGVSVSLHQVGLAETLMMARQLGCPPGEVVIFGVKPLGASVGHGGAAVRIGAAGGICLAQPSPGTTPRIAGIRGIA